MTSAMLPPRPAAGRSTTPPSTTRSCSPRRPRAAASGGTCSARLRRNPTRVGRRARSSRCSCWSRSSRRGSRRTRPTALPGAASTSRRPTSPAPARSREFPLGLDRFGGDVLSKLIWGARAIADHRRRLDRVRPDRRHDPRVPVPACSAAGSTRSSCASSTSCSRCRSLLLAVSIAAILGQTQFVGDDRDRCRAGADLRAPAALVDAAAAQRRLRALGADARPRPRQDHDEPRAAELRRTGHRAGHAVAGHGRHRGGGAVVPRPRRRTCPQTAEWGRMLTYAQPSSRSRRGSRSCRASASRSPRSASRCSARRCARRWIRARGRADAARSDGDVELVAGDRGEQARVYGIARVGEDLLGGRRLDELRRPS